MLGDSFRASTPQDDESRDLPLADASSISLHPPRQSNLRVDTQITTQAGRDSEDVSPRETLRPTLQPPRPAVQRGSVSFSSILSSPSFKTGGAPRALERRPSYWDVTMQRMSDQSREAEYRIPPLQKEPVSQIKAPAWLVTFFITGVGMSLGHIVYYVRRDGQIVGDQEDQEANIRVGTAFAFLAQITLSAAVWIVYTQWLWRTIKKTGMSAKEIDASFSFDVSIFPMFNLNLLRKLKLGSVIAFFAWCLVLPPFFTPATLTIYRSTNTTEVDDFVPLLQISQSQMGQSFAYSPPMVRDTVATRNDSTRSFVGPRTTVALLGYATASLGEILPIKPPYPRSKFSLPMYGPIVRCEAADQPTTVLISSFLQQKMNTPLGSAKQTESVYFAFVPVHGENGTLSAGDEPRGQVPSNGTNELWMTLSRYTIHNNGSRGWERIFRVCHLYNASLSIDFSFRDGKQNISGTYDIIHRVDYPRDSVGVVSNMSQHAYSALMWVLTDQLVGSLGWFEEQGPSRPGPSNATQFGVIDSPIQHTSLLGSSDLDLFFDLKYIKRIYRSDPSDNGQLGLQRRADKNLAQNRTLDALIEELSFNMTLSLLHNELLAKPVSTMVKKEDDVNRYSYARTGLIIPYVLANGFTLIVVVIGLVSFYRHGVLPEKKFTSMVAAAGENSGRDREDTDRMAEEARYRRNEAELASC